MHLHFSTTLRSRRLRHHLLRIACAVSFALTATITLTVLLPNPGSTALTSVRDISVGEKISPDDLATVHLSSSSVTNLPTDPVDLNGQYALVAIPKGSIVTSHDLIEAPPLAENETVITVAAASTTTTFQIGQTVSLLPLSPTAHHRTQARIMPEPPAVAEPTDQATAEEGFTPLSVAVSVDEAAQLLADSQEHGLLVVGRGG